MKLADLNNLQLSRLYAGQLQEELPFSPVNFFIGKNGSGKTQLLTSIHEKLTHGQNDADKKTTQRIISTRLNQITERREAPSRESDAPLDQRMSRGDFGDFYLFLQEDRILFEEVNHWLKKYFGRELVLSQDAGNDRINIREMGEDGTPFPIQSDGGGVKNFIAILTYTLSKKVKTVLIDEIEEGTNPQIVDFLLSQIERATQQFSDKQFFIVAHAPSAIYIKDSWTYVFFNRDYQNKTNNKIVLFSGFGGEDYKGFHLDLDAFRREAFFADRVILVEGFIDYYILNALTKQLGYKGYALSHTSYLPLWGSKRMKPYYDFFKEIGKEVICMADEEATSTLQDIPDEAKKLFSKYDILMYSKAFQDSLTQGEDEKTKYDSEYGNNGNKKAQVAKAEVDQILIDDLETLRSRYGDVVSAIESVFGAVDEHDFSLEEVGDIIRERRSGLQRSYGKIAAASWDENGLIKDDLVIKQVVKKIAKIDGNTVRLIIDFKGEEYYTDFNLLTGHPNHDAIQWNQNFDASV